MVHPPTQDSSCSEGVPPSSSGGRGKWPREAVSHRRIGQSGRRSWRRWWPRQRRRRRLRRRRTAARPSSSAAPLAAPGPPAACTAPHTPDTCTREHSCWAERDGLLPFNRHTDAAAAAAGADRHDRHDRHGCTHNNESPCDVPVMHREMHCRWPAGKPCSRKEAASMCFAEKAQNICSLARCGGTPDRAPSIQNGHKLLYEVLQLVLVRHSHANQYCQPCMRCHI